VPGEKGTVDMSHPYWIVPIYTPTSYEAKKVEIYLFYWFSYDFKDRYLNGRVFWISGYLSVLHTMGNPWEVSVATLLVNLRLDDSLPLWKKVGQGWVSGGN
jgi:hypothetical protein